MLVGDVIQIKVVQSSPNVGDELLNVFFYEVIGAGTSTLAQIIDQFQLDVVLPMRNIQAVALEYKRIEAIDLYDLNQMFTEIYPQGAVKGTIELAISPPSTAVGYTLQRSSRTVRNGSKRFGGIPNVTVQEGKIVDSGYIVSMNTLATALAADIEESLGGNVLQPVIVGRVKTANPDYPATSRYPFIYSLPTAPNQTPVVRVQAALFSLFTSTQVSRKTNR